MNINKMSPDEQKSYDEALRRIEVCRRRGKDGTGIHLCRLGLTAVPPEIGQLTALTYLSLHTNLLTTLP